ncbi:MAG: hypothetical protein P8R54_27415 [Myxococcota bacterium]|nr:hypothetical protein [Myxococcota bacterium]
MKGLLQLARTRGDLDRVLSIYARHGVGMHYKRKSGFDIDTWRGCLGRYFFAPGWCFPVADGLKKPAQRFRLSLPDGVRGHGRPLAGVEVFLQGAPQLRSADAWRAAIPKMGGRLVSASAGADLILCAADPEAMREADARDRADRHAAEARVRQHAASAPIDPLPYWPGGHGRQRLKRSLPSGQTLWVVRLMPSQEMFSLFLAITNSDSEDAFEALYRSCGSARRVDPEHGVSWAVTLRPASPDLHACFEALQMVEDITQADAAAARAMRQRHRPLFAAEEVVLDQVVPDRIKRSMSLVSSSRTATPPARPQHIEALQQALRGSDEHAASAALDELLGGATPDLWEQLIAGTVYSKDKLIPGQSLAGISDQRLASLVCLAPESCRKAAALRSQITALSVVLTDLSMLASLTRLEALGLTTSPLTDLSSMPLLPKLTRLGLHRCPNLTSLAGLSALPALQSLGASRNPRLTDIAALSPCTALTHLDLSFSPQLSGVDGLRGLSSLTTLTLAHCDALQAAPGLLGLRALKSLTLTPALTAWLAREASGALQS